MRAKYQKEIEDRITGYKKGTVFTAFDFFDIASTDATNKALSRLMKDGKIRRLMQGVYDVPEYSALINEFAAPRIDNVARALAQKYNWTIAPAGETALNSLHLSTQVPNVWKYVSNGPNRDYSVLDIPLSFRNVKQREITGFSEKTAMVIQALRAIGKDNIAEQDIRELRRQLNKTEKQKLKSECRVASSWIVDAVRDICSEENN